VDDEARALVERLGLEPHPEGGYYRETYRSPRTVATENGPRAALTSILFLLAAGAFSAFHRIASDEAWHFYRGDRIAIELLHPDGTYDRRELGPDGPWQTVVPAGVTFASHVVAPGRFALVGCDVAPGFDFADFTLCERDVLLAEYPAQSALVRGLTR